MSQNFLDVVVNASPDDFPYKLQIQNPQFSKARRRYDKGFEDLVDKFWKEIAETTNEDEQEAILQEMNSRKVFDQSK